MLSPQATPGVRAGGQSQVQTAGQHARAEDRERQKAKDRCYKIDAKAGAIQQLGQGAAGVAAMMTRGHIFIRPQPGERWHSQIDPALL